MTTRRMLIVGALAFAAGANLVMSASADNKSKSCSLSAASCTKDEGCDPECCALLSDFCCSADAADRLNLTEAQAAEVKSLRAAACDAVAPHAKKVAAARRELRAAVATGDSAAVRASAATLAEATTDGLLAAEQFTSKLVASLTPEQRATVEKAVACSVR